jgi:hypothetical protein
VRQSPHRHEERQSGHHLVGHRIARRFGLLTDAFAVLIREYAVGLLPIFDESPWYRLQFSCIFSLSSAFSRRNAASESCCSSASSGYATGSRSTGGLDAGCYLPDWCVRVENFSTPLDCSSLWRTVATAG